MKTVSCLLVLSGLSLGVLADNARPAQDADELLAKADRHYAEGSFELAHKLYVQARERGLEGEAARHAELRVADSRWRSAAASNNPDTSELDTALQELNAFVASYENVEDRDDRWAEAQESLGGWYWDRRESRNWSGWNHYQQALDWWAGSRDIERARERYLAIAWNASEPRWWESHWDYGAYGNYLPVSVLQNATKIAESDEDKGHAHFLLAMTYYRRGGSNEIQATAEGEFEAVLALGKENRWYDDALYHYGVFNEEKGDLVHHENGVVSWRQDYVEAVELYRRLLREFKKGETRYYDSARNRIQNITAPTLSVHVSSFFTLDSEVQYQLRWRNVKTASLALYPVDLARDPRMTGAHNPDDFVNTIDLARIEPHARWDYATGDEGEHQPGDATLYLKEKPPLGAYVLAASGSGVGSRALVLVSDASLVVKNAGGRLLAWFTGLEDGKPIAEARLWLWERYYEKNEWRDRQIEGVTQADGTALFDVRGRQRSSKYYLGASLGARQAFSSGSGSWWRSDPDRWKIYAFTDRPAYRPNDEVQWKLVARTNEGGAYATPAGEKLTYKIHDPRGTVAKEGEVELNAFGAAAGTFETGPELALGEYWVEFRSRGSYVGRASLFRIEEYKLPEYEVSVKLPEDPEGSGKPKLYRVGDEVTAEVVASYYFGGAVADAEVEVLVYQRPYYHYWQPRREYPWFYADTSIYQGWWGGYGQMVTREQIKTDANGVAKVTFSTPTGTGQDYEYTVEARVVDASRREVVARNDLRVTRQAYYVRVEPKHKIHRPGDRVEIEFEAKDPNGTPVSTRGKVKVTRDRWIEIWVDPEGNEVRGTKLEQLKRRHPAFPPPGKGDPWRLKFSGYEQDVVAETTVKTGEDGTASWSFAAEEAGYYRVAWASEDGRGAPISGQAAFYVADENTTEIGYRYGGVDLIVDKDTFRSGEKAAVMVATPTNDRYVLLTIEGEDLHHYEVVHVTGTVKLVMLDVTDDHVPNVYLGAMMVADRQAWSDVEEIVVPPVDKFLDVELGYDKDAYEPGEEGTVTITARDHDGNPVSAEIALAVYDDALSYIQSDLAGDPRQFFYGERHEQRVWTRTLFNHSQFLKLVRDEDGNVVDERYVLLDRDQGGWYSQAAGSPELRKLGYAWGEKEEDARAYGRHEALRSMAPSGPAEMADMAISLEASRSAMGIGGGADELFLGEGQRVQAGIDVNEVDVRVRTDFRDTAIWRAAIVTDDEGRATATFTFPDSTTRWHGVARAAGTDARFGQGEIDTQTRQPLIARLQAPRFFQVGDEATVSANLNNNTSEPLPVHALLEAEGLEILGLVDGDELRNPDPGTVTVAAGRSERLDWLVRVTSPGEALLRLRAASPEHSDGMEKKLPIYAHGIEAYVARSGKMTGEEATITLDLPSARGDGTTSLSVQIAPSLAVTMLDALPYLVEYPYGCTEQTLSRFLPAVVVLDTLKEFGLSKEDALEKVFGGIEREFVDKTHPDGTQDFDRLDDVVQRGLERLYDFQHSDGGWAWWKTGESDHWMTAYVVWGLTLAEEAGLEVKAGVLERGRRFLELEIVEEEQNLDLQAWMLHALAKRLRHDDLVGDEHAERAFDNLWEKRQRLNAYTRALFTLAAVDLGKADEARILAENLANGVIVDDSPDTSVVQIDKNGKPVSRDDALRTAHWGEDGVWRRWSEGGVEATAFAIKALVAVDPEGELTSKAVNWLVQNRRGNQWSNTRDTAITILALSDYLKASGEISSKVAYELSVNGVEVAKKVLTRDALIAGPSVFDVDPELLRDGANEIRIVRTAGEGPLYFSTNATFFSEEEPIPARGNQLFVRREYYKLVPVPTLLKGVVYEKRALQDGETIASGERVEVILTVEVKNHLEYLVFEDLKPAGLEAVQVRSGEWMVARELKKNEVNRRFVEDGKRETLLIPGGGTRAYGWYNEPGYTGRTRNLHQELRDRKVALFVDKLPQGVWEMRYELRAEVPGKYHALPVLGHAMYVPEVRCNSNELRVDVLERGASGS